ncbi:histidine kinase [candidate division WOR_3 bacterium SM23_42]|uniref:Histidine kinase n=1 Tax=candidate division WOR_3 bacterium SM23_42 TaxID=1703779 RepID=A0A0S8FSN3_UNCW3|nr:MAG: histidine kinase [candidate division WOR_3 bacterium SM23_42]
MKKVTKNDEAYLRAKKRVAELKGFYAHLIVFVIVNMILVIINLVLTPRFLWFLIPLLGWGVGLFFHAVFGFGLFGVFTKEWEERKIKQYMGGES